MLGDRDRLQSLPYQACRTLHTRHEDCVSCKSAPAGCRAPGSKSQAFHVCAGPGEKAASAGAAAGLTDAHPLGVDEAGGPVTTTGAVTGQTVSTEAAEEAASHRVVAPRYRLPGS